MRVVCVDGNWGDVSMGTFPNGIPIEGETYTVTHQYPGISVRTLQKMAGYFLLEKPAFIGNQEMIWNQKHFVPESYYQSEFAQTEQQPEFQPFEQPTTMKGE